MNHDPSNSPIDRHCVRCGKLVVTLHYNKEQKVWSGDAVRHIDTSTSLYVCRDCDEPDIPPLPLRPKPKSKAIPKRRSPLY